MSRALLVFNSLSGGTGSEFDPGSLSSVLTDWGWDVQTCAFQGSETILAVQSAVQGGAEVVIGVGGDGTLNQIARGLLDSKVALGVIPCGTGNDLSRALGIPLNVEGALEVIRAGERQAIDVGWINGHIFLNTASIGISAKVVEAVPASRKQMWGPLAYVAEVFKQMRGRKQFLLDLEINGRVEPLRVYEVFVANGPYFGGGYRTTPEASVTDGLLDVIIVESGLFNLLRCAECNLTLLGHLGSRRYRTDSLVLHVAEAPVSTNVDGDAVSLESPLKFKVSPRVLNVLAPRKTPQANG